MSSNKLEPSYPGGPVVLSFGGLRSGRSSSVCFGEASDLWRSFRPLEKLQIFGEASDLWRSFKPLEKLQTFGEASNLWRSFRPLEKLQTSGEASNLWRSFRPLEKLQTFGEASSLWRSFKPLEKLQTFGEASDLWRSFKPLEKLQTFGEASNLWRSFKPLEKLQTFGEASDLWRSFKPQQDPIFQGFLPSLVGFPVGLPGKNVSGWREVLSLHQLNPSVVVTWTTESIKTTFLSPRGHSAWTMGEGWAPACPEVNTKEKKFN